jgi:hypothetical protein
VASTSLHLPLEIIPHNIELIVPVPVYARDTNVHDLHKSKAQIKSLCRRLRNQRYVFTSFCRSLDLRANKLRTSTLQLILWMRPKQIKIHLVMAERLVDVFALFGCELVVVENGSCDV